MGGVGNGHGRVARKAGPPLGETTAEDPGASPISDGEKQMGTGWCFGTCFIFPYRIIIPIDFHIFQRGSNHQPYL